MPASEMPDKKKNSKKRTVDPADLLKLRTEVGHTQQQAADFLYVEKRTYQNWEYDISRAPLAFYELYELKAIARGLLDARAQKTKMDKD